MEEHAPRRYRKFTGTPVDRGRPVRDICADGNCVLDGWLAIRQLAVCRGADDVRAALFQPLLLQGDGQDLPGADGDLPDFCHGSDFEYGFLSPALINRGATIILMLIQVNISFDSSTSAAQ